MSGQAVWAPFHRALARWNSANSPSSFPPNAAPSMDFLGSGMQDHRLQYNKRGSSPAQPGIAGWWAGMIEGINLVPSTAAVNNIVAAANPASGTPMTLVSTTGAGITAITTAAPALFVPTGLKLTAGACIEALPGMIGFGTGTGQFNTSFYSRTLNVGRCVSVTGVGSGSGGTVLISGYDIYGYPLTQLITLGAGANTVNSTKAFKVVTSVVPNFTDTHTISVGTADIFGFPINVQWFNDVRIVWNNAVVTANTGFTAAVNTSPSTNLLGDVRGTYAVQSASDGTKRLGIDCRPSIGLIAANPTTGLFGQPQV